MPSVYPTIDREASIPTGAKQFFSIHCSSGSPTRVYHGRFAFCLLQLKAPGEFARVEMGNELAEVITVCKDANFHKDRKLPISVSGLPVDSSTSGRLLQTASSKLDIFPHLPPKEFQMAFGCDFLQGTLCTSLRWGFTSTNRSFKVVSSSS